jgi:hypothetical protein
MRPLNETTDEVEGLSVDGLEVEEIRDEDTIRQFVVAWRRRVSRELALDILQAYPERHLGARSG